VVPRQDPATPTPSDPAGFNEDAEFPRAVDLTRRADVAVVVIGEVQNMISEMASRSSLELSGRQLVLSPPPAPRSSRSSRWS
jgi:hypothetical protein